MPIVKDDMVADALEYMAEFPHPLAVATKALADANNKYTEVYSEVYLEQGGTVGERKAKTELDEKVRAAREAIVAATFKVNQHKARVESSGMIFEIWRSEGANKRATERVK